ncbi:hypothetical protein KAFR_0L02110 [Kazachstania africana CBS 2517]|uniref:Glutamine amidotransferase type-2 domain-containing protein n=1 Tax=Kazachstania africana (strain ATCC 22294 / BCRC 22015 / CBS 2517 / CECT 1963 / NBRC 1671 / NRRL Y-8276) TaxID=1071382 RepID=H2B2H2_KAZAF|nr:hypothetical protein KAFR_0L02110 [Kazachstania africana CBS 2517]CCF60822.1 hypothetical protein KAFR_0L02110 [Kazachstania africana CBS 2517]
MCGILLHYNPNIVHEDRFLEFNEDECISVDESNGTSEIFNAIIPHIANRGPNYSSLRLSEKYHTAWFSSVLALRLPFTKQSLCVEDRYVLQFNGELYNKEIKQDQNDTQFIASLLSSSTDVIHTLTQLDGEFAYTIYDLRETKIYFGRDSIGKRSLCFKMDTTNGLYVASCTGNIEGFENCLGGVIYIFDLNERTISEHSKIIQRQYEVVDLIDENMETLDSMKEKLYTVLNESVSKRVTSIHPLHIESSPISVLFSGGLDCSVLVALICEQLRIFNPNTTVELLTVGFENPRIGMLPKDVPDRKLAISSSEVLKGLYPDIDIKLVYIDIPYEEYLKYRPTVINLMYPKQTEMDLSIAIAFFFASRGSGFIVDDVTRDEIPYQRKGIVLFSGLGADELYGGYHKFVNRSLEELSAELTGQINNIHDRNLNRDDKVIASNGVEVRYPFLDHNVVQFSTQEIPINYKVNKLILRKVASDILHLGGISTEPKRAIQFGSKSAKMTKDGNKHGTDLLK